MRYKVKVTRTFAPPYSTALTSRKNCELYAQGVCDRIGVSVEIIRNQVVVMRYWRDDTGLQYLEY